MSWRPFVPYLASIALQAALIVLPPIPWAIVVKPLPLLVLAAYVAYAVPLRRSWPLVLGLSLGGCGDIAMHLRHRFTSSTPLLAGMGFFFLGHVCYSVAFFRERAFRRARAFGALVLAAFALAIFFLLLPHLGRLAVPIGVYAASLTAMTALAALRRSPRPTVLVGAALFFFSDVLIGARLARAAVPRGVLALILPTYYLGQYWIAQGWARDAFTRGELSTPPPDA
jgi:uncharacterized membrane protein YhhN